MSWEKHLGIRVVTDGKFFLPESGLLRTEIWSFFLKIEDIDEISLYRLNLLEKISSSGYIMELQQEDNA